MKIKIIFVALILIGFALQSRATDTEETIFFLGEPNVVTPTIPGIAMLGGGKVIASGILKQVIQWMEPRTGNGDFVVLTAIPGNSYTKEIFSFGKFNSVETLIVNSKEIANLDSIAEKIKNAEGILITGGNQADYINFWKGTKLLDALNSVINKVPIAGISAGLHVLGEYYYSAINGSAESEILLMNPYHELSEGLGTDFIKIPFLKNTLTESHFSNRDRKGRHISFLARLIKEYDLTEIKGIAVDEKSAALLDENGDLTVIGEGDVYFTRCTQPPEECEPDKPLKWTNIEIIVVSPGSGFSLKEWAENGETWFADQGTLSLR